MLASHDPDTGTSSVKKLTFSVPEVAVMLGISRASAYTYVRTGLIRSISLGGRIVVPCVAIEELLAGDKDGSEAA